MGDAHVGKSDLCCRLTSRNLSPEYVTTIGVDYMVLRDYKKKTKVKFWDLSGDPRFNMITKMYIPGVDIILLVYDVSERHSLLNVIELYKEYILTGIIREDQNIIVVGNKIDKMCIDSCEKDGVNFSRDINAYHTLTSAKLDLGITNLNKKIVDTLIVITPPITPTSHAVENVVENKKNKCIIL